MLAAANILLVRVQVCYEDVGKEFESRNIGICAYANLNDRRKVHAGGYDRTKDNSQVIQIK